MTDKKSVNNRPGGKGEEPSFEELLQESFKAEPLIEIGSRVETRVVAIDNDFVYLDLGTRMEGTARRSEFVENGKLVVKEGDLVTVHVAGKRSGAFQCARWFAHVGAMPQEVDGDSLPFALRDAYDHGVPVEGKIITMIKGGFEVTILGKKAFCPLSQIDRNYCDNPEAHLGKTYTFQISQLADDGSNIVLSRKEVLFHEDRQRADRRWQEIEVGTIYEGTVTHLQSYGAFVDIGGIDGLLHVSEISHSRIDDARVVLQAGQKLMVEIIALDRDRRKINLSLKSQMADPWDAAVQKMAVGDDVDGDVIKLKSFGAFVEISPGLVGLLHISRLGTDKQHQHPKEVLKIGDKVRVRILEIDLEKKNISLTMEKTDLDVSAELNRLREEQEETLKSHPSHISSQIDANQQRKSD